MSDDLEGKERIENLKHFEQSLSEGRKDWNQCAFMFPFRNNPSLIRALTDKPFSFVNAVFHEEVIFEEITISESVELSNITFKKRVVFDTVKFADDLSVTAFSCTFHDFEFLSSPIKLLALHRNAFLGKFKASKNEGLLIEDEIRNQRVGKVKIHILIFIDSTVATETVIRLGYLDVGYFLIRKMKIPVNSEVNIGECDFNNLVIESLRNSGKFRIYKINATKTESRREEFKLTDSSLGDSEFQDVDLNCYKQVFIQDNLLSDLKYTTVQWSDNIETGPDNPLKKKQDTYRILKNIAQQNNDAPQAIEFYAKEMTAYSASLSGTKGKYLDKIILKFNRWTNSFGLNWLWPIIWILGTGFTLYVLLLLSIDLRGDSNRIWGELKKFPVFLNPLHKPEFTCCGKWSFWTYSIDSFFRIIEAILIYQTIIAFRKFTRKL